MCAKLVSYLPHSGAVKDLKPTLTINQILSRLCTSDSFYFCLKIEYTHSIFVCEKNRGVSKKKVLSEFVDIISFKFKQKNNLIFIGNFFGHIHKVGSNTQHFWWDLRLKTLKVRPKTQDPGHLFYMRLKTQDPGH